MTCGKRGEKGSGTRALRVGSIDKRRSFQKDFLTPRREAPSCRSSVRSSSKTSGSNRYLGDSLAIVNGEEKRKERRGSEGFLPGLRCDTGRVNFLQLAEGGKLPRMVPRNGLRIT